MQTWNQTGFPHECTTAMDKDGREHILIIVNGSYAFPRIINLDLNNVRAYLAEHRNPQ